jgi:hypothetical protein
MYKNIYIFIIYLHRLSKFVAAAAVVEKVNEVF